MRRSAPALSLALAAALAAQPPGAAAQTGSDVATGTAPAPACGAPPALLESQPLPGVFTGIASGELRILVVGSASTAGGGTSGAAATWPQRLEARLGAQLPGTTVRVESFGGRGTLAADHARIIAAETPRLRPHLVIWQLGTVEAARGLPAEEMVETVQSAAAALRAARGELTDLVLMDMQFSRFFRANANVEPYRDGLRIAAAAAGAGYFSRWDLMLHWVESERLDLERAAPGARKAVADKLHDCLAQALTALVLDGVGQRVR